MIDVSSTLNGFKASIRKSKGELEVFSFNKEITIVCMYVCKFFCQYVCMHACMYVRNAPVI